MEKNTVYLTTTLPYVNAEPHVGFASEIVRADTLARYNRLMGKEVFFNTGTDEHGLKIYQKATEAGKDAQQYVDEYAEKFDRLKDALNLSYDNFIRTTDEAHKKAAQEFWKRCDASGDIYKKNYKVKYCVGCELEKTDSELQQGKCSLHPSLEIEIIEEENYFFKFSKYQERLLTLYEEQPDFVIPSFRLNEIKVFVERGLEDFSISRLKSKMPWGVSVPDDDEQVMYVWFDALVNYISAIGWPDDMTTFEKWWPVVQLAGKDNLRQQSAMWQAMLISADLPPSKQVFIGGFINSDGQKMSKSTGNVINPFDIVHEYGTDALRYYLLRHVHPFEDSDMTDEKFKEAYNANLANGLGNLVARVMKMAEEHLDSAPDIPTSSDFGMFKGYIEQFEFQKAMDVIWERIGALDTKITETAPFKLIKENPEEGKKLITELVIELYTIGCILSPVLPDTNEKIKATIKANKMPVTLFPRKE